MWKDDRCGGQITICFPICPLTIEDDISVSLRRGRLDVEVVQQADVARRLQGRLYNAVHPSKSGWSLEGKGEQRRLTVSLCKAKSDIEWPRLFELGEIESDFEVWRMPRTTKVRELREGTMKDWEVWLKELRDEITDEGRVGLVQDIPSHLLSE